MKTNREKLGDGLVHAGRRRDDVVLTASGSGKEMIDICIPTFKRPSLLQAALESLENQTLRNLAMRIIVVDNDWRGSAASVVKAFAKTSSFEVVFDNEPRQGLSYVRNRLLSHVRSRFFAFLDDDETVDPDWLETLFQTLGEYEADVVFGPVHSHLPENSPLWARFNPYFNRVIQSTGTMLTHGPTNNVLIRYEALGARPQEFEPSFSLTSGEDTEFFYNFFFRGKKMVWCDEAAAHEKVPSEQVTIPWICRRAYRGGQVFTRIFVKRYDPHFKMAWFLKANAQLLTGLGSMPFVLALSYPRFVRLLSQICGTGGQLTALLGKQFYYDEYSKTRYRTKREGSSPSR